MKSRNLSENKDMKMEIIEMESLTRKLLPALNEMVKNINKTHKLPECMCLVIALNKETKQIRAGYMDSIGGIAKDAVIINLNVKEEFLDL